MSTTDTMIVLKSSVCILAPPPPPKSYEIFSYIYNTGLDLFRLHFLHTSTTLEGKAAPFSCPRLDGIEWE